MSPRIFEYWCIFEPVWNPLKNSRNLFYIFKLAWTCEDSFGPPGDSSSGYARQMRKLFNHQAGWPTTWVGSDAIRSPQQHHAVESHVARPCCGENWLLNVVDAGFPADISDVELIELAGLLYIIVYCINTWNNIVEYVFLRVCNLAMQFVLSMG